MKKILSLLVMMVMSITAFAQTDGLYKGQLNYELLVGSEVKKLELPEGTFKLEKRVDGHYNVEAKGCDFTAQGYDNWYEITCDDLEGTVDENGVTVIDETDVYVLRSSDWAEFKNTSLTVKFKDDKVYAHFEGDITHNGKKVTLKYTFGTDDFGTTEPSEPEVTETSNKTYKSNLHIFNLESEDESLDLFKTDKAEVNIVKYSDNSCKVTLKNITLNDKTADLVFVGKFDTDEPTLAPLAEGDDENGTVTPEGTFLMTTSDNATTEFFGAAISATFEWQELSENEIKMFFNLEGGSISYEGEFNYKENSETAINGIHAANGEAQLFTVDGVKLSKLQKGLNIVRTADGKVKKVLVK